MTHRDNVKGRAVPGPVANTRIQRDPAPGRDKNLRPRSLDHALYQARTVAVPGWGDEIHVSHGFVLWFEPTLKKSSFSNDSGYQE